ncbi:hypothetical protein MMC15_007840 [Xylographa vitiligo]|nr:hypothetical protein [Xylographa vitiligo]
MADTLSAIYEAIRLTESFVPLIDIAWIEGVLDGTISLPEFQMGEEVGVVTHDPNEELGGSPDHSSVGLPTRVHSECDADERLPHPTHEDGINSYCNCQVTPFLSDEVGRYRGEAHGDHVSIENVETEHRHVHTELGPMTRIECLRRPIVLFGKPVGVNSSAQVGFSIPKSISRGAESCIESTDVADLDHNITGASLEGKDATHQLAEADNNKESEPNTEGPASTISDDQWEYVSHILPLEEVESQTKLDCTVDTERSVIPSVSGLLEEDQEQRIPEHIGATTIYNHANPDEAVVAIFSSPETEATITSSEVGEGQYTQSLGDSIHSDTSAPTGLINMADDNDWVCICVSSKVARVAKEAREMVLAHLTKVLGFIVKDETDFPYQKETNPWMIRLFDERLLKALQHILDDLECLEEVLTKPKHGHGHPHINSRMSGIIEEHIHNIGDILVAEVEAVILVKDFLTDMVDHELGTIAWAERNTKHKFIAVVNQHTRQSGGLNLRMIWFLSYLQRLSPHEKMSLPKRNVGPGRRIEGHYYQRFVELPLERWGGLESLLDIHEDDAVMNALAYSVYGVAVCGAYLNVGPAARFGFGRINLSETGARVKLSIWFGERDIAMYSSADINFHIVSHHPDLQNAQGQVDATTPITMQPFTIKHICLQPQAHSQLVIETDDKDFFRLYRQYKGDIHPQEAAGPGSPALEDSAQKINLVGAGTENLEVNLDDFKAMMETYDCEDYKDSFTQRRWPLRGIMGPGE